MSDKTPFPKNYAFSIRLLVSILIGSFLGIFLKKDAVVLKPFGDIFLNLLFTVVVPLVFFSISSAVAGMRDVRRLGRIMGWMMLIFVATGIISSTVMIAGVKMYPPVDEKMMTTFRNPSARPAAGVQDDKNVGGQIVRAFTAADFTELLSKKNMLALIVFSLFMGLATSASGDKGRPFGQFLLSGNAVMTKVIGYILWYAPIGLGAYFAYLAGVFGPELLGSYGRAMMLYYPLAIFYFFIGFSLYAYLAAGIKGVKIFWVNIIPAALTALATGSSVATIPTNLEAAKKIGIPQDIREVVIPIGATIHMDGSCLAAVLKIAFLFGIFQMDFSGVATIMTAIAVALLSGTVISGIPAGGMLGEMLILTLYGFPLEAMPMITMIGTLVDPPATMVNATGDNVASMMVARVFGGKDWRRKVEAHSHG